MVQQTIDKRVTSCTHATQKRQSLLDNSQHSRVWVWRIVDQCLPASQITCRLGSRLRSRPVSGHSTYFPLSTNKHSRGLSRPTPRTQSERHSAASMHIQLAGSLPVMSAPECRTMTSRAARRVPLRRTSAAAAVSRTARLSLHRMLGIPHCRPSSPKLLATGRFVF